MSDSLRPPASARLSALRVRLPSPPRRPTAVSEVGPRQECADLPSSISQTVARPAGAIPPTGRRPGKQPAMDPDPAASRPPRSRPGRTQDPALPAAAHRRPHHPRPTPNLAAHPTQLALGTHPRRRLQPADHTPCPTDLNSAPQSHNQDPEHPTTRRLGNRSRPQETTTIQKPTPTVEDLLRAFVNQQARVKARGGYSGCPAYGGIPIVHREGC